ncbi:MAG: hypothetical protein LBI18_02075 [Planctomycetaceae bacterium]|nr:hypothetical protein [Planctomycetaceae bacterium]
MFRRRVFTHHHVGDSRLAPAFGWQFVLPNRLAAQIANSTQGQNCLAAMRPFGERSPTTR